MTLSQVKDYMSNNLTNQGTWKLSQLKKLKFERIKRSLDKLVQPGLITFVTLNLEVQRQIEKYGKSLQTKNSKKQRLMVKMFSYRRKKLQNVANWKIFQQGQRSVYQIIRANGTDTVYMSFGAMIKDFTREDLIELYRLVMQKYGTNRPEDEYDRVLWSDLRTMFDAPLIEDAIWSLPLQ
ncbi:hypothetical protein Tco_1320262 [Tanacetum coccineum]